MVQRPKRSCTGPSLLSGKWWQHTRGVHNKWTISNRVYREAARRRARNDLVTVFQKSGKLVTATAGIGLAGHRQYRPRGQDRARNRRAKKFSDIRAKSWWARASSCCFPNPSAPPTAATATSTSRVRAPAPWESAWTWPDAAKTAAKFPVEVSLSYVEVDEGVFAIAFVSDISQRKRLEEQLLHAQKMEAVGRLAGGVAHDFNNMLTVISGYNRMILDELSTLDPLRGYAEEILKAADRAGALTNQLLAFSRRQIMQPRVINVNAVIDADPENAAAADRRGYRAGSQSRSRCRATSRPIPATWSRPS